MRLIRILFPVFLICTTNCSKAQLFVNFGVDTLEDDVRAALHFYGSYLQGFQHHSMPDFTKYWSAEDCKKYKYPDQLIYAISSDAPTYTLLGQPTIVYIKPTNDYVHIKTLFALADSAGNAIVSCITNHYVQKEKSGRQRFINPIDFNEAGWRSNTVRNITFTYPSYHRFNRKRADSLIQSVVKLETAWKLQPINIRYYFADTKEEIEKLRGFDLTLDMGNRDKPTGISDDRDNIVYCGGLGENYFHEVVHIYLNHQFPNSPLKEGLAVFYGGTLGHYLSWHVPRLDKYLQAHKEIDLEKDRFTYMDNYTNPNSTIQGMLCAMAYKKDGMAGLKRIMSYSSMEEVYSKEFNVKPGGRDSFIRKSLASYQ